MEKIAIPSYQESLATLKDNLATMLPADALAAFNSDAEALEKEHPSILQLHVGDQAPNFTLSNAVGEQVNLYEVLKLNRVVLTFYRGTWCPYCNLALHQYQSVLPAIEEAGAVLIAISPQTPDESLSIKEKNELQFEVLSDHGNMIAKKFTTVHANPEASLTKMAELGYDYNSFYSEENSALPIPATFIIEQNARISFAKSEGGDYRNRVEASEIINALNELV